MTAHEKTSKQISSLYSHGISRIRIIFIYGSDFNRQPIKNGIFRFWINENNTYVGMIILCSSLILYRLRRNANIENAIFWAGYMEMIVVLVAGGNIRARHKWEKMFFVIAVLNVLIGSFFGISIFLAKFSVHSIFSDKFEKIDTFEKLAKQKVTFFIGSQQTEEHIKELLK